MKSSATQRALSTRIYHQRINRVIDHIRENLTEPLSLEHLARIARFSPYHFHRIFKSIAGEPLHACVRRLRLEKAVFRMQHGPRATLTQIALECGFASSSDFSRAFKQVYGFSPRGYSRERFLQDSKIRQDLLANAGYGFDQPPEPRNPDRFRVRLVDWPARRIAYVRVIGTEDMNRVMAGYERLMAWAEPRGLQSATLLGMSPDDPDITPLSKYQIDWGLILPAGVKTDGEIDEGVVRANRFAYVSFKGDLHKEDRAWKYLVHVWLPQSGYEPTHDPAMEVYRKHPTDWSQFEMDCSLPIRPLRR